MNANPPEPTAEEAAHAANQQLRDSHIRSIFKAVTWRVIGTMDTFMVSFVALHLLGSNVSSSHAAKAAGTIAGLEVVTKIVLYYLHERAWARVPLGTLRRFFGVKTKT